MGPVERVGPVRSGPPEMGRSARLAVTAHQRTHCRAARSGQQKETFSRRGSCAPRQRAGTPPPPAGGRLQNHLRALEPRKQAEGRTQYDHYVCYNLTIIILMVSASTSPCPIDITDATP